MIILRDVRDAENLMCWESKNRRHMIVSDVSGGQHFSGGGYWDDIKEELVCIHCGTRFLVIPDEKQPVDAIPF